MSLECVGGETTIVLAYRKALNMVRMTIYNIVTVATLQPLRSYSPKRSFSCALSSPLPGIPLNNT